jgi:predicted nucleic acid-binding protein
MIILDTNVISELINRTPEARVVAWADRQRRGQLLTTAITAMELRSGAEELHSSRRKRQLEDDIEWALDELIGGRILDFDRGAAYETAAWQAHCKRAGRSVDTRDAQIAGIALARNIPIATRDTGHFANLTVKVINPWEASD